ncbi:MAG: hypothetical protein LKK19_05565 [Bacteroidales bacterium]|jgi:hypothetical protein|nr:hypothetical protein [Bacteroidales bacterium]MCI2122152.1 hypothetical protein [Bacteroidales bacterium]MCI2146179.1 hypothetical protein [Bacteroidales bacterium]
MKSKTVILFLSILPALALTGCNLDSKIDPRDQFIGKWLGYCTYDSLDLLDEKVNPVLFTSKCIYKFDGIYEYFYYEGSLQRNAGFFDYDEGTNIIYFNSTFNKNDTLVVNTITRNVLIFDDRQWGGKFIEYHKM